MDSIFLECATFIVVLTATVFGGGLVLYKVIGRGSEVRRLHGRYVLAWSTAGYFLGGCAAIGMLTPDDYEYFYAESAPGSACIGLLLGLAIGHAHGALALAFRRNPVEASTGT